MEREQGKVIRIVGGTAIVQMEAGSQCLTCSAKQACTALSGETVRQIEIPVVANIKVGDNITLSYRPQDKIISALLVFMLPVILLISGYFIGLKFFETENKAVLTSFLGLIFAFILIWGVNKFFIKDRSYLPTILKVKNQKHDNT